MIIREYYKENNIFAHFTSTFISQNLRFDKLNSLFGMKSNFCPSADSICHNANFRLSYLYANFIKNINFHKSDQKCNPVFLASHVFPFYIARASNMLFHIVYINERMYK